MRRVEHYQSEVASVPADVSAREIAEQMKAAGVGSLVVVDDGRPVGIVTDRDLLCRVIAAGRDPANTLAVEIMSQPLSCADPAQPLERVVEGMAGRGVRRLPVVRDGQLAGIVSLDDLLVALSGELADLAEGARRGFRRAQRAAGARGLARDLEDTLRDLAEQVERLSDEARDGLRSRLEALWGRVRGRGA